jgi:hypothetical protein
MLITINQAQNILNSPIFGWKLPPSTSYKFAKLVKTIHGEMATFDAERLKLIESHGGVMSEDKTRYDFEDGGQAFNAAFADLLKTTVDIGCHFPMPIPEVEFTPAELMGLEPLFDVDAA